MRHTKYKIPTCMVRYLRPTLTGKKCYFAAKVSNRFMGVINGKRDKNRYFVWKLS
jgi:hypothetical protein